MRISGVDDPVVERVVEKTVEVPVSTIPAEAAAGVRDARAAIDRACLATKCAE
jgi:hypothetical protein